MSEVLEIKAQIDKIGEAWEASKKTNDELLLKQKNLEGGQAELKEKQAKIDVALNDALELKKTIMEVQDAVKRVSNSFISPESKADLRDFSDAFKVWVKKGMPHDIKNLGLSEKQEKALQSNIDPQGGYTVNPFMGAIEKILFDTSPVRSLARTITIGTDEYVGYLDDNEFGAGWIGEVGSRSDTSTADIGKVTIPVREMYARFTLTERLLEDSSWNIEQWATQHVADRFGRLEATGYVTGSSPNQPQGLATATAKTSNGDVYTRDQIGAILAASTTAITKDELVSLRALLKSSYRANAYFFYNRDTEAYIRKLTDGQGNYLWQPSYQLGEADTLIGQRTVVFEDMADRAASAISVGLGDLRNSYLIVDRVGMSVLKDPFTAASSGKVYLHMRKRVGGGIVNFDSMKYLKQAAS
ncbi:MAG: phage major capsid protein [Bdellovibrio sp. CG_4_9_14_3_um_filter_39_7]|nr:MAG: phage major capsid protein [Bdellovibrio sp. CG_4_9_14_3_um_filter_39_7]